MRPTPCLGPNRPFGRRRQRISGGRPRRRGTRGQWVLGSTSTDGGICPVQPLDVHSAASDLWCFPGQQVPRQWPMSCDARLPPAPRGWNVPLSVLSVPESARAGSAERGILGLEACRRVWGVRGRWIVVRWLRRSAQQRGSGRPLRHVRRPRRVRRLRRRALERQSAGRVRCVRRRRLHVHRVRRRRKAGWPGPAGLLRHVRG